MSDKRKTENKARKPKEDKGHKPTEDKQAEVKQ